VTVQFAIIYDDRTRLGYDGRKAVPLEKPDMRPYANIGTERNVVDIINAGIFQICKQSFPLREITSDGGRGDKRYSFPGGKIRKKARGIVGVTSRVVFARRDAPSARDAFAIVYPDFYQTVAIQINDVRKFHRAFPNASVAAYTVFRLCFYDLVHALSSVSFAIRPQCAICYYYSACPSKNNNKRIYKNSLLTYNAKKVIILFMSQSHNFSCLRFLVSFFRNGGVMVSTGILFAGIAIRSGILR